MAQFDIHRLNAAGGIGYVLCLQADFFASLDSVLVVPVVAKDDAGLIPGVNVELAIDGVPFVIRMELAASVPRSRLGAVVQSARNIEYQIKTALDRLISGY